MKLIISLIALLCASDVAACKLASSAYDVTAFFATSKGAAVAFAGRVESVRPSEDDTSSRITIATERWWKGPSRERVVVTGSSGTMRGTDCQGVFDFTARVGSTVLIIGEERSGEIYPSGLLSREENIAKLPQALAAGATPASDNIGKQRLPVGATLMCEQVIDGRRRGKAPASIAWESYGASKSVPEVVGHYEKFFDRPVAAKDVVKHTWRLGDGLIYSIFAASDGLQWLQCADQTSGIASVILGSRIHSAR